MWFDSEIARMLWPWSWLRLRLRPKPITRLPAVLRFAADHLIRWCGGAIRTAVSKASFTATCEGDVYFEVQVEVAVEVEVEVEDEVEVEVDVKVEDEVAAKV